MLTIPLPSTTQAKYHPPTNDPLIRPRLFLLPLLVALILVIPLADFHSGEQGF